MPLHAADPKGNPLKKALWGLLALPLVVLGFAGTASAHSATVEATCPNITVIVVNYTHGAHLNLFVDGKQLQNQNITEYSYAYSFTWAQGMAHTWSVQVTAPDWPTFAQSGTQQPCNNTTTTRPATTTTRPTTTTVKPTTTTAKPTTTTALATTTTRAATTTSTTQPGSSSTAPTTSAATTSASPTTSAPVSTSAPASTAPSTSATTPAKPVPAAAVVESSTIPPAPEEGLPVTGATDKAIELAIGLGFLVVGFAAIKATRRRA